MRNRASDTQCDFSLRKGEGRPYIRIVMSIGTRIEEAGTLLAEGEDVLLRRDAGGRYRLDLRRVSAPPHGACG